MCKISKPLFISLTLLAVLTLSFSNIGYAQTYIDTVIHYVEGTSSPDTVGFDVKAYVSVVDASNAPINDLDIEDFSISEDSTQVEIDSVEKSTEPISLVLLMDASGSMNGSRMDASKTAAQSFITSLEPDDSVAVNTFNEEVTNLQDFSTDHENARRVIGTVQAKPKSSTCLYDAAYKAVQQISTVPSGRRAVILFTDGVDEKFEGGGCSVNTVDDLIDLASEGGTRTPIYTLGFGQSYDEKTLKRIASHTGGRFLYAPNNSSLDNMFKELSSLLRSQYVLSYFSNAGPGSHTLSINTKYLSTTDTDTRNFLLPEYPLTLRFKAPEENEQISGIVRVDIDTIGSEQNLDEIEIQIDDENLLTIDSSPYEGEIDLTDYDEDTYTLVAIAKNINGTEITRVEQEIEILTYIEEPTATPESAEETVTPTEEVPGTTTNDNTNMLYILGAVIGVITIGLVVLLGKKKKAPNGEVPAHEEEGREFDPDDDTVELKPDDEEDPEPPIVDPFPPMNVNYGTLIVLSSDQTSIIGDKYTISKDQTTLGRRSENDFAFPEDKAVSRLHAVLIRVGFNLMITESINPETQEGPTYGTKVNDIQIEPDGQYLQDGDEIVLGKRLKLRFVAPERTFDPEETIDGINNDATMDGF